MGEAVSLDKEVYLAIPFGPASSLPDPAHVISPHMLAPRCTNGASLPRFAQRMRRAKILAVVRHLLAEGGWAAITIKRVADLAGLANQTVYNLVGGREELVAAAISEYILALSKYAEERAYYPNPLLSLADCYWQAANNYPDYIRAASLVCEGDIANLCHLARSQQEGLFRSFFLKSTGSSSARVSGIFRHVATLTAVTTVDWAKGELNDKELRSELASCQAVLASSAMDTSLADQCVEWASDLA